MQTLKVKKSVKPVEVVDVTFAVPQDQVNMIRQMAIRYILDNNESEVAYKLLELSNTKLRDDLKIWR